jgi:transcriptional regulator with GAF, ATPase, and Fis domain
MSALLAVISGPLLKDAMFHVDTEELFIGRDVDNGIRIPSKSVSRRHCCVRQKGGSVTLVDLDSRNGTFVNGSPVKERVLEHGDLIRVGDAYFRYVAADGTAPPILQGVTFDESDVETCQTFVLRREDASYLQLPSLSNARPAEAVNKDLCTLVTFATKIGFLQDSGDLERQILETISEALPAERGAILLWDSTPEELSSEVAWNRAEKSPAQKHSMRVSRTILRRVASDSTALLVNDISADKILKEAGSIVYSRPSSILCAPLLWAQKTRGAIYLDMRTPGAHFAESDLQLLMGIAGVASPALVNLQRVERLQAESKRLQAALDAGHNMLGESAAMRQLFALISKVASNDSTVLLYGESGTGKELAARAIHKASSRRDAPFVAINCAAIPGELLESELFGHEKGAFTGAALQKKGQIELANTGTLFLDEIGELALPLQAKLLRVLQEREFTRVGGGRPVHIDIRVLAATNRDLSLAVKAGTFRQDLYYRLNVISITLPPLRERRDDILLLAKYFVSGSSARCNRQVLGISPEAENLLLRYDWPGNIRELENAIERAVVLGSSEFILPEDLPECLFETLPPADLASAICPSPMETMPSLEPGVGAYQSSVVELKKQLIIKAVHDAGGNYTEAAKSLRVSPNYLHRLIRNLNIKSMLRP